MGSERLGLLTFSFTCNPGSALQAYALHEAVTKLGGVCEVINYQKLGGGKQYIGKTVFYPPIKKWRPKTVLIWTARLLAYNIKMPKYIAFQKKYLHFNQQEPLLLSEMPEMNKKYDTFIVGSDQVWNFWNEKVDYTYFLDFVESGKKKISYAASFGQEQVPDIHKDKVTELLKKFSDISVREYQGQDIVKQLIDRDATLVLDPTLLWDKDKYLPLVKKPKTDKYVFLYLREKDKRLESIAEKIAKEKNLKIIRVYSYVKYKGKLPYGIQSPEEWLGCMKNAEYIVTNSFHAICFSLIFEKEFFIANLIGVHALNNSRLTSIVRQFGLEERIVDLQTDVFGVKQIDYGKIRELLGQKREESLNYLKGALEQPI